MKKIKVFLFSAVLLVLPAFVLAHQEDETGSWRGMMSGWGGMSGGAWSWLGLITYLVWLGISVLILIWLFKKVFGKK